MWILWTLVLLAVAFWLGFLWLGALFRKYAHTFESYVLLVLLGLTSLWAGRQVIGQLAPEWDSGPLLVTSGVAGFLVFTLLSYVAVALWLAVITRPMDDRIANLEEEEDGLLRILEAARWQSVFGGEPELGPERAQETFEGNEAKSLNDLVDSWREGGGAARIRSLKVLEWEDEIAGMSREDILKDIQGQGRALQGEQDQVRKEQARVKGALLKLELLSRDRLKASGEEPRAKSEPTPAIVPRHAELRRRLQEINREIAAAKADKAEFLGQKVTLRWGRRQ